MVINYTTIVESRFDAPFLGTLISGVECSGSCPNCFNQHLRSSPRLSIDADLFIESVRSDPFSDGIILAGLEWLDTQYDEALYLIDRALKNNLQVILYTRRYKEQLEKNYSELFKYKGLYIKCGPYIESKKVHDYFMYGVQLATSNQYIIQI